MIKTTKRLHVSHLGDLIDRHDPRTNEKVRFSIAYVTEKSGSRIDTEDRKEVICINYNQRRRTHTYKWVGEDGKSGSGEIRVIADCLVMRVNDTEIIKS